MDDILSILQAVMSYVSPPEQNAQQAVSTHVMPAPATLPEPAPPPPPQVDEAPQFVAPPRQDPTSDFLNKIGHLESGNNDEVKHGVIRQGVNKGTRAIGRYGLTPLTIISTLRDLQSKGEATVELPKVAPRPPKGLKAQKKEAVALASQLSPQQTYSLAYHLANSLMEKTGGDQERMAMMWNSGTNLPQKKLTGALLEKHEYVKKFRKLVQKENPGVPQLQEEVRLHPGAVSTTDGENVFQTQRLLDEAIASSLAKKYRE